MYSRKNILFIGQLTDISGYGTAARSYLNSLVRLAEEDKISLGVLNWSFEGTSQIEPHEYTKIKKYSLTNDLCARVGQFELQNLKKLQEFIDQDYEVVFFLLNDWMQFGDLKNQNLLHSDKINLRYICSKSKGVYPCVVWESDSIPHIWKSSYSKVPIKKLLCACEWNKKTFDSLGYDTQVLPYGMNFEQSRDQDYFDKLSTVLEDKFVFTSVFQWGSRKGIEKLIRAFQLEFVNDPDAYLVLKTYYSKPMTGKDETRLIRDSISKYTSSLYHYGKSIKARCKIVVINKILTKEELNSLYSLSDVYVTTTRGEGFGLPIVEALNYEVPVVSPSIGGHLDFLDKGSNFFIDSTLEPVIDYDNSLWSSYEGNWVEASVSSTKRKMRECFELSKEELSRRGKQSSLFMKDYLSFERCETIWERVLEI